MAKDINLTVCLRFHSERDRETIAIENRKRKKEKKRNIPDVLVAALIVTHRTGQDMDGWIELEGKKYLITFKRTP